MPRLIIDGKEIDVPEGTNVLEAADRLGIMIPRFCYHPAMGSVGACRVCAVKFLEGPVKGLQMSCMIPARDGMVVSTDDPEAVAFRKYIIECLMLHHPHDCPVCDEGGHCLLQDETVSGGHGIRRYPGRKRTYRDQYLGVFIKHEMNRCIHCFRCRRFYQEYAGYKDLGAMQIGNRMYFGRYRDGPLESPFSGNLVDVCPTGVFTDLPFRYRVRRWDLERAPSVCIHCSLGCNTTGGARYREMMRQEARSNPSVSFFICDRGRYGFDFSNHPDRPRFPRVGRTEVDWKEGIGAAAQGLRMVLQSRGPGAIACLGSSRNSLETQAVLKRFCSLQGLPDPWFFIDPVSAQKARDVVECLDEDLAVSMREIEEADLILAVGIDAVNEAPVLALAMRQAWRKGALVAVIDPRPVFLPLEFEHIPVRPEGFEECLGVIVKRVVRSEKEDLGPEAGSFLDDLPDRTPDPNVQDRLVRVSRRMKECNKVMLLCGHDVVEGTTPRMVADLARLLGAGFRPPGLFYLMPGANAFGASLVCSSQASVPLLDAVENGDIRALVLVENDPFLSFPDRDRLEKLMDMLEFLVVLDYLPSNSVRRAGVVLPTATVFERKPSGFVNQEGRFQIASPVHFGGIPVDQVSPELHPPRTYQEEVPGGQVRPADEVLADLYAALTGEDRETLAEDLWSRLSDENPVFRRLVEKKDPDGIRLIHGLGCNRGFAHRIKTRGQEDYGDHLLLITAERTFGTEELSIYSRFTRRAEDIPRLQMHPSDGSRLGLFNGDQVSIDLGRTRLEIQVHLQAGTAQGVMILPRHHGIEWQHIAGSRVRIPEAAVRKVRS